MLEMLSNICLHIAGIAVLALLIWSSIEHDSHASYDEQEQ